MNDGRPVVLATKFAPFPYRLTGGQFSRALDRSLERLGVERVDLYYIHFPYSPVGPAPWIRELARAVNAGKVRAAGVSNFSAAQMRRAVQILGRHGIPLAANQVQYSLTHRKPEHDGVLQACRELDVALVAYRPIAGGGLGASGPALSWPRSCARSPTGTGLLRPTSPWRGCCDGTTMSSPSRVRRSRSTLPTTPRPSPSS